MCFVVFPIRVLYGRGLFWHSAHFNRVRTFTILCECVYVSLCLLVTAIIFHSVHICRVLYAQWVERENNALKMDCAICCLVFLFLSRFVGYCIRIVVDLKENLFRTVQFDSSLSLRSYEVSEKEPSQPSTHKQCKKCFLYFFPL